MKNNTQLKNTLWADKLFTPIDLTKYTTWELVKRAMDYHYPQHDNTYEDVFNRIKNTKKKKYKDNDTLTINIVGLREKNDIKEFGELDEYYDCSGVNYGLDFQKWDALINMPIEKRTLESYTVPEILAHFIFEMTWYGDETTSITKGKKIADDVKKIQSDN